MLRFSYFVLVMTLMIAPASGQVSVADLLAVMQALLAALSQLLNAIAGNK